MKTRLIEHHEAIRIMERQGLEQNATYYREQGDVGANAQRHHQDGDDGKTGGATKRAQTKAQIACQGFKPVPGPDGASLFTNKSEIAKGAQGRVASLFFRNAAFPLLLFLQFQVGTQLPLEVRISLLDLPPVHLSFSSAVGHITRATASAICFHRDSSARSCFLP